MAFSNIEKNEKLDIINIAIVNDREFKSNLVFKEIFKNLSDSKNKDRLFETKYVDEEEAKKLLEDDEIIGYLFFEDGIPKIIVKTSGINQTVLKQVTEEVFGTSQITNDLAQSQIRNEIQNGNINLDYEKLYTDIVKNVQNQSTKINNISNKNLSYTMIEFYTLIAMTCLYGGILGMTAINQNLANMSGNGKRVSVAPIKKGKIVVSSVLASYVAQLIGLAILFLYTVFVLKVDYGDNFPLIILLGLVGSLAGLSFGVAVGTIFKTNENVKTGIVISFTMLGCFLSGMMGITMKYVVDTNCPIVNKLNPASMITDGLYSLYYYDTLNRYFFDIASLLVFSLVMIVASNLSLRRQKYDSI